MPWQDIVIAVGQWVFLAALFPSLLSSDKPALATSLLTGGILAVFAAAYFSLGLVTSALSTVLVSAGWLTLAFQKYRTDKTAPRA